MALAATMVASGCDQKPTTVVHTPPDTSALRGIIRYYTAANGQLGRPPKEMSELRAVLATLTDDPDKYLRSTRDGQEFVVVWGQQLHQLSLDTILAYEQTGVDGRRLVLDLNGVVREVSADEFSKLKFPKGHKPGG